MNLSGIYRQLVALKLDPEQIAGVLEIIETDAETRKAKGRERVQKWREKQAKNVTVTEGNVTSRLTRGEGSSSKKDINKKESKEDTSPSARPSRGSRIPDDFEPDIVAAMYEGLSRQDAERQALSFCDFWRSKPGKDALKLDWPATWRVWYRRNLPKPQANAPPAAPRNPGERALLKLQGTNDDPPHHTNGRLDTGDGQRQIEGPGGIRGYAGPTIDLSRAG